MSGHSDAPTAFPLAWPTGWPRTLTGERRYPLFRTSKEGGGSKWLTLPVARDRLERQLDALGARLPILSTNLELRLDGRPRAGQPEPSDPGVAVYFQLKQRPTVMPCDRYRTVAANIAAIAAHIEAVRAIERYGVGTVEQMFTGFQAIRGPGPKPWREILGIRPDQVVTPELIRARQRELARLHHPDAGGSSERMAEINAAADDGLLELRGA
jgi:hypothetical protein